VGERVGDLEKVSILVVDDRPENILAMRGVLNRPDYDIVGVPSGADALKPLLKHDFAVILLDVLMPGMDGFETARLIRQREASRHIPIIFLTAAGHDLAMIHRGYASGAVDYLLKPIDPDIVQAKVGVFVDLYRKTQQLKRQEEKLREAEREKNELLLRETEAEYLATFEQAPSGVAHATIDGRWLRVNKHFLELAGLGLPEILTKRIQDLTPNEEASEIDVALKELVKKDEPVHWPERRFLRGDGSIAWVSLSLSLLRETSGKPKKVIVVAEEITERKRADQGRQILAEASKLLLSSFEVSSILPHVLGLTLGEFADSCTIALTPNAHDNGSVKFQHYGLGASSEPVERALKSALDGTGPLVDPPAVDRESWLIVTPITARNHVYGALAFSAKQNRRRYRPTDLALAEDLALRIAFAIENARLYTEAQLAIGARDEFLSVASHELRTPLTPLLLQLQSLQRARLDGGIPMHDPNEVAKVVQRAERQVHRLTALVENLLDVSRIRAGQLRLTPQELDLAELTREVAARFAEELKRSGCGLEIEASQPVNGSWDRLRVEQVITNLLSNAIKYGSGRPIHITVDSPGSAARIRVSDRGIGIAPEKQSSIFERFGRAVSARSYGGLGLGLYITKQIVEAHKGEITVDSRPQEGSTFTVILPKRTEADP
jgi:PAS domain S-box-containing protein